MISLILNFCYKLLIIKKYLIIEILTDYFLLLKFITLFVLLLLLYFYMCIFDFIIFVIEQFLD